MILRDCTGISLLGEDIKSSTNFSDYLLGKNNGLSLIESSRVNQGMGLLKFVGGWSSYLTFRLETLHAVNTS